MGTNARSNGPGTADQRLEFNFYSKQVNQVARLSCQNTTAVVVALIFLLISLPARTQQQLIQRRDPVLIHGEVTTIQGEPVDLATVEMRDLRGVEVGATLTDRAGSFAISTQAPRGAYVLLATKQMRVSHERITLDQPDVEIKIALPAGSTMVAAEGREDYSVSVQQLRVPEKVQMHLKLASQRFAKSQIAGAQQEVERALQVDDSCPAVYSMRAFLNIASRNLDAAIDDAKRAALLDPYDADAYLAQATAYNSLAQFQDAEEASDQALHLRPDLWQGRLELAKAFLGQRRFVLAWRELDKLNEDFPDVHLVRADVLVGLHRGQKAAEEFSLFLQEAPDDPRNQQVQRLISRESMNRSQDSNAGH